MCGQLITQIIVTIVEYKRVTVIKEFISAEQVERQHVQRQCIHVNEVKLFNTIAKLIQFIPQLFIKE